MNFKNELKTLHKKAIDEKVEQEREKHEIAKKKQELERKKEEAEVPTLIATLKQALKKAASSGTKELTFVIDEDKNIKYGPKYYAVIKFCEESELGCMDESHSGSMRYSDDTPGVDYYCTQFVIRW